MASTMLAPWAPRKAGSGRAPAVTERDPWLVSWRISHHALGHGVWAFCVTSFAQGFQGKGRLLLIAYFGGLGTAVHALLGGVLGILLAFRSNQAYGRYWRATEAFGELRDALVSVARRAAYLNDSEDAKEQRLYRAIVRHLIAVPVAVTQGLKGRASSEETYVSMLTSKEVSDMKEAKALYDVPYSHTLLSSLSVLVRPIHASDDGRGARLTLWSSIDSLLNEAHRAAGVLATIHASSPPRSYALHVRRFLLVWIATLPIALLIAWPVHLAFHPVTAALITASCAWALYATDELAHLVGQPFEPLIHPLEHIKRAWVVLRTRLYALHQRGVKPRPAHRLREDTTFPVDAWSDYVVATLRQHLIVQSVLERRLRSRTWVVSPEDCMQAPHLPEPSHQPDKFLRSDDSAKAATSRRNTTTSLRAATAAEDDQFDDEDDDDPETNPAVDPDVL